MNGRDPADNAVGFGVGLDLMVIALTLGLQVATPAPPVVERSYSNGVYPQIDSAIRSFTQPFPFAIGDALAVVLAFALVFGIGHIISSHLDRTPRQSRWRWPSLAVRLLLRLGAVGAFLYAWFLCSWGYGYDRIPLAAKVPVHADRVTPAAVDALADRVVDGLNANASAAHAEMALAPEDVARHLQPTWQATIRRLGDFADFAPYQAKGTIFDRFMTASGTTGFTDPWTHEVNLATSLLPFERPAIYAHEWSHLAGFNDETEANFIAAVSCTASQDPLLRYSGYLLIWSNLPATVHVTHHFARVPFDDLTAIRKRYLALVQPQVQRAASSAYDGYLKANGVKAGYASYALFIRWMTGADFDRSGLPVVANTNVARAGTK